LNIVKINVLHTYEEIFNNSIPIELYYKLINIHLSVENILKNFSNPKLGRNQIGDVKFHVTLYFICRLTNKLKPKAKDIAEIDLSKITNELIEEAIENTYIVYDSMGGNNSVAKGKEFVLEVLEQVKNNLQENKRWYKN
jgi:hypothetical protein